MRNIINAIQARYKAIYGFVVSTVGTYIVQSGLTLDQVFTKKGFHALLVGVVTGLFVHQVANK